MTFTVLTLFPGLFAGFLGESILARAIERGLVAVRLVDIRDHAADRHRVCDDAPYGGGAGMVMKPEPLAAALEAAGGAGRRVVYLTPSGKRYDQRLAAELAAGPDLLLVCGRYEGVDQRVIDAFVTDEVSVGDYVLSGGEVAA
ncbi:MAG TPA: tRNA (guanosine(37)-N1)-methyltransferase TrmD, partial [Desulfobacterales bacterium]|nr:tRNA (guanosine(37)-N1)-methyltransferase TrmD [Desulfobacterales bacterium]